MQPLDEGEPLDELPIPDARGFALAHPHPAEGHQLP